MSIDYPRLRRVLERSTKLAQRRSVIPIVKTTFDAKLAAAAARFLAAHRALLNVEQKRDKERGEALVTLEQIQQPYDEARTAMETFIADLAIPRSLSTLTTVTDQREAIGRMLEIIDARKATEQWAQDLSAAGFGALAPVALREIDEWVEASGDHEDAVRERALASAEAYPRFLRFRDQVRASYGDNSIHYRRLIVDSSGRLAVDDIDDVPVDTEVDDDDDVENPTGPTEA